MCVVINFAQLTLGIGLNVHNIRAKGSYIWGTGGASNGLVPMLRVFNNTARYVDQGGNKVSRDQDPTEPGNTCL